ncbi:MAG: ferritin [Desulfobulbaceae bacterium]|nr:ferritin [Desulfobulbaceae bacterium]
MLSKKMEKAINGQINAELYSSYMYLAMSAWFSGKGMGGFANWMRQQAQEEMFHAIKMYDFIGERGGKVVLEAIDKPPGEWKTSVEVFQATLAHEQKVTGLINDLVNQAMDERDHASNIFLQWFITEQVEEEANATAILDKLKLIGKETGGLFALDQELAQRVFTLPAPKA